VKPLRVLLLQTQNPQCQAILRRLADAGAVDLLDTADPRQGVGLVGGPRRIVTFHSLMGRDGPTT